MRLMKISRHKKFVLKVKFDKLEVDTILFIIYKTRRISAAPHDNDYNNKW